MIEQKEQKEQNSTHAEQKTEKTEMTDNQRKFEILQNKIKAEEDLHDKLKTKKEYKFFRSPVKFCIKWISMIA